MKCSVLLKFVKDKDARFKLMEEMGLLEFQRKFHIKKPNYLVLQTFSEAEE